MLKNVIICLLVLTNCIGVFATDLPADFVAGTPILSADVNSWKDERDGNLLPISESTLNYADATANIGSATYRWINGYYSGSLFVTGNLNIDGSISTPTTFSLSDFITVADDKGIYLGAGKATIEFDDQATDEINFINANVGIGTSSPQTKVHIKTSGTEIAMQANTILTLQDNGTTGTNARFGILAGNAAASVIDFADANDNDVGGIIYSHVNNYLSFRTNAASDRLLIDSAGNVGIGTSSPTSKLSVTGDVKAETFTATKYRVSAIRSTSYTFAGSTTVTWNAETYDTDGMHDTITNSNRVTLQADGNYMFTAFIEMSQSATTNDPGFQVRVNLKNSGGAILETWSSSMSLGSEVSTSFAYITVSGIYNCSSTDYFEVIAIESSTQTVTLTDESHFEVHKLN
jgi:hypothetical protein